MNRIGQTNLVSRLTHLRQRAKPENVIVTTTLLLIVAYISFHLIKLYLRTH